PACRGVSMKNTVPSGPERKFEYSRSRTPGIEITRWLSPSKSICTETGTRGPRAAGVGDGSPAAISRDGDSPAQTPGGGEGRPVPTPRSSSLSGSNGLESVFFNTARYSPKFSSYGNEVMSSHWDPRPKSVDARNHKYFPLASQAGHTASARPSVTCFVSPVSTLLTKIA